MTTVLIVDDQVLIRRAVREILDNEADLSVVGEAVNGRDAVTLATSLQPDIVLMDIRMPELDGIEATKAICAVPSLENTRVLILTTFEEDEYLIAALRAGASGFIGKGAEPDEITRAVRAVHAGDALLSPSATRSLITKYVLSDPTSPGAGVAVPPTLAHLTDREREVLLLVARGRSNQEIADELVISPHTAKTHVNRIMAKLYAHDRAQLVILAYESGMLAPGGA
ncbi:response regulator transcription factor [Nocardiopsis sp. NRRL B-16309]|uniref:response regulator n=1 Tax=Nocardiopsis sp. NRRL B-16309 TaxID=1519494 RepID=UPI0006ADF89E|nr:response regulator transcription factor [Nocardiopsis sp. NRRL B-16309]KOX16729.1 LuxR family transcriptional regulator [Nocardiopsis sp. NRRL B-16309]